MSKWRKRSNAACNKTLLLEKRRLLHMERALAVLLNLKNKKLAWGMGLVVVPSQILAKMPSKEHTISRGMTLCAYIPQWKETG
jgi:hypothetical protein